MVKKDTSSDIRLIRVISLSYIYIYIFPIILANYFELTYNHVYLLLRIFIYTIYL